MMRMLALPLLALLAASAPTNKADPAKLSQIAKILASDAFEGRGPGTPGEEKTVAFLVDRFKALGLQPGGPDGQWTQRVAMIHTRIGSGRVDLGGVDVTLGKEINLTTVDDSDRITFSGVEMVFVGYGVSAPEAGWDDFKDVDVKNKVVVFLVNDPDFEAVAGDDAADRFGGKRMTYYGRWTYKFEEAARRGAVAALIVHDTAGAGYPWSTANANNGENYAIARAPGAHGLLAQGWIEHDAANALFARAGLDLDRLRVQARSAQFKPVDLSVGFNASLAVTVERIESRNVLARLPGKRHPNETVMFGAHWDAYGKGSDGAIRPGANDDGLGVAGVLELARLFKAAPRTDRSLVFALWTGEERGLLGSEYYGSHPVYPLATTAANLTLDILNAAGPSKNVVLVGKGNSSLDALLADAAKAQGRVVVGETFSERGLFFRADHFSVARRGVPSLLIMQLGGAPDLVAGGVPAGQAWLDGYMACYHKSCDKWDAGWDLRGAAADVDLFFAMGNVIANQRAWPVWRAGFEFEKVRTASAGARR